MADKEVKPVAKATLKVTALPAFHSRRFVTLSGLTKAQYRALQAGEAVEVDKKAFNKEIMKEAKDGSRQNRLQ